MAITYVWYPADRTKSLKHISLINRFVAANTSSSATAERISSHVVDFLATLSEGPLPVVVGTPIPASSSMPATDLNVDAFLGQHGGTAHRAARRKVVDAWNWRNGLGGRVEEDVVERLRALHAQRHVRDGEHILYIEAAVRAQNGRSHGAYCIACTRENIPGASGPKQSKQPREHTNDARA